jgi:hypothetical protein
MTFFATSGVKPGNTRRSAVAPSCVPRGGLTETGYHRQSGEGSNWGTNPVSAGRATRSAGAKSLRSPTSVDRPQAAIQADPLARVIVFSEPGPLGESRRRLGAQAATRPLSAIERGTDVTT